MYYLLRIKFPIFKNILIVQNKMSDLLKKALKKNIPPKEYCKKNKTIKYFTN